MNIIYVYSFSFFRWSLPVTRFWIMECMLALQVYAQSNSRILMNFYINKGSSAENIILYLFILYLICLEMIFNTSWYPDPRIIITVFFLLITVLLLLWGSNQVIWRENTLTWSQLQRPCLHHFNHEFISSSVHHKRSDNLKFIIQAF